MMVLSLFVPGSPRSKGSFRPIKTPDGRVFMKQPAASKDWEGAVRDLASRRMPADAPGDLCTPARVRVDFFFLRPKKHFGTGRNAAKLKRSAPEYYHAQTPDVDKLARAILDALTGIVYDDDCRVAELIVRKVWGVERTGALVTVERLLNVSGEV